MNSKAVIPIQKLDFGILLSKTQQNQTVLKNTKKLPCHTFETALTKNMLAYESCDQMSLNNEKTVSKISVNFLNVPFEKAIILNVNKNCLERHLFLVSVVLYVF